MWLLVVIGLAVFRQWGGLAIALASPGYLLAFTVIYVSVTTFPPLLNASLRRSIAIRAFAGFALSTVVVMLGVARVISVGVVITIAIVCSGLVAASVLDFVNRDADAPRSET
jgi:hypothetical protein